MNQRNTSSTIFNNIHLMIKNLLNNYWFLGILIFTIIAIISIMEPNNPVKDERFMIYEINQFSKLGFWGHINNMKNYQGPLYYYLMGLLVSVFKLNILGLRVVNCIFSAMLIMIILKIFELKKINKSYILLVLLNPYFLLLTAPLIYNDNLPLLCLFLGLLSYLKEKHITAIICFSCACLMRQNLIFAPAAIMFVDMLLSFKKLKWYNLIYITPLIVLFILFFIWGGHLSSPGLYKEIKFLTTINGFNLNGIEIIKSLLYQLILLSIFALPQTLLNINWDRKLLLLFTISLIILVLFTPTHINLKFHQYLPMYNYGGYLDQYLSKWLYITLPMSAMVITLFLNQFTISIIKNISKNQLIILVFIALNLMFYSITPFWDKYYVMMGVFIPFLLNENKNSVKLEIQN